MIESILQRIFTNFFTGKLIELIEFILQRIHSNFYEFFYRNLWNYQNLFLFLSELDFLNNLPRINHKYCFFLLFLLFLREILTPSEGLTPIPKELIRISVCKITLFLSVLQHLRYHCIFPNDNLSTINNCVCVN